MSLQPPNFFKITLIWLIFSLVIPSISFSFQNTTIEEILRNPEVKRLKEIIESEMEKDIVILGDMNDNPGFKDDPYERDIGIDGITQLIRKTPNNLESSLTHIAKKWRFSCIYFNKNTNDPDLAWIDRILFTRALYKKPIIYKKNSGKIHYELLNPLVSDHLPVSAVFVVE